MSEEKGLPKTSSGTPMPKVNPPALEQNKEVVRRMKELKLEREGVYLFTNYVLSGKIKTKLQKNILICHLDSILFKITVKWDLAKMDQKIKLTTLGIVMARACDLANTTDKVKVNSSVFHDQIKKMIRTAFNTVGCSSCFFFQKAKVKK